MINSGLPFNLISQCIIDQYNIAGSDEDILAAQHLKGGGIRLFKRHRFAVETKGTDGSSTLDAIDVFGANITGCKMILGRPWLDQANLDIDWPRSAVCFPPVAMKDFPQEAAKIRARIMGLYDVSTSLSSADSEEFSNPSPVVACVGLEEFAAICKQEGSEAYLVSWRDVSGPNMEDGMESLIGAILADDLRGGEVKPVTLPAKYADYADVFNKHRAVMG